jgi:diguanylate cyclase (GGDEF)-like protein
MTMAQLISQWRDADKPKLLLVDNQAEHIEPLYRLFKRTAHLFLAHRAEQALPMCEQHKPDVVLVNLNANSPMNGLQICRELSISFPEIKVLALTAQAQRQQEILALKAGVADCISSPLNPMLVRTRVATQLLIQAQFQWLREAGNADLVPEVWHQKRFETHFKTEWQRSVRNGQALTLLLVSIDHLETLSREGQVVNDVMNTLGAWLREQFKRPADLVCRYKTERFACLLPDTPWQQSMALARQIEHRAREAFLLPPQLKTTSPLTLSIGVATRTHESQGNMNSLLALAQARLSEAQAKGRGQVSGVLMP